MGENDWHYAVNASQFGEEGSSANAAVAQTSNKRDVAVSRLDKACDLLQVTKLVRKTTY